MWLTEPRTATADSATTTATGNSPAQFPCPLDSTAPYRTTASPADSVGLTLLGLRHPSRAVQRAVLTDTLTCARPFSCGGASPAVRDDRTE
jgi:hypothetical protein